MNMRVTERNSTSVQLRGSDELVTRTGARHPWAKPEAFLLMEQAAFGMGVEATTRAMRWQRAVLVCPWCVPARTAPPGHGASPGRRWGPWWCVLPFPRGTGASPALFHLRVGNKGFAVGNPWLAPAMCPAVVGQGEGAEQSSPKCPPAHAAGTAR